MRKTTGWVAVTYEEGEVFVANSLGENIAPVVAQQLKQLYRNALDEDGNLTVHKVRCNSRIHRTVVYSRLRLCSSGRPDPSRETLTSALTCRTCGHICVSVYSGRKSLRSPECVLHAMERRQRQRLLRLSVNLGAVRSENLGFFTSDVFVRKMAWLRFTVLADDYVLIVGCSFRSCA